MSVAVDDPDIWGRRSFIHECGVRLGIVEGFTFGDIDVYICGLMPERVTLAKAGTPGETIWREERP
jgi:hypothetical protein